MVDYDKAKAYAQTVASSDSEQLANLAQAYLTFMSPSYLLKLLEGEFSSMSLEYNDHSSSYYKAGDYEGIVGHYNSADWISEEDKQLAIANNSIWWLTWYPNTPIGFNSVAASSIEVLYDYLKKEGYLK